MQQATIHTAMFMEVLAAKQADNEQLANFYVERFPPDVRKAYDAWLTQRPFENPNADPHPFVRGRQNFSSRPSPRRVLRARLWLRNRLESLSAECSQAQC
jgi:hypothetical protein